MKNRPLTMRNYRLSFLKFSDGKQKKKYLWFIAKWEYTIIRSLKRPKDISPVNDNKRQTNEQCCASENVFASPAQNTPVKPDGKNNWCRAAVKPNQRG